MKKNIEVVVASLPLIYEVKKDVSQLPNQLENKQDLLIGLNNLYDGVSASLLIQLDSESNLIMNNIIKCKDLTINVASRKVLRDNKEIFLTPKEFDILYFLISNRGQVFSKEQIYQAVWDDKYLLDDSNIMAFIRKIRKKIEPDPDNPIYLLTIWGIGYKFNDNL